MILLDEAEAVDDFVQVEVGVLPGLHDGLFSLKTRGARQMSGMTITIHKGH